MSESRHRISFWLCVHLFFLSIYLSISLTIFQNLYKLAILQRFNKIIGYLFPRPLTYGVCLTGMRAHAFEGDETIVEVVCSGEELESDATLLSLILYADDNDNRILASVNPLTGECTTSDTFSSCVIDARDSRHTRLRSLVLDLKEGTFRTYSCEVTAARSGHKTKIILWKIPVSRNSEYLVTLVFISNLC